eukprot:6212885-Pleurochrysis_carterae.AAC.4
MERLQSLRGARGEGRGGESAVGRAKGEARARSKEGRGRAEWGSGGAFASQPQGRPACGRAQGQAGNGGAAVVAARLRPPHTPMAACACAKGRQVRWRAWLVLAWAAFRIQRSPPPCPNQAGGCVCR